MQSEIKLSVIRLGKVWRTSMLFLGAVAGPQYKKLMGQEAAHLLLPDVANLLSKQSCCRRKP